MSQKFLKTHTLDIHAGGRDLIFPHHENEIAQAQALTDKPFAKYWIHHGLLTIEGHKMAKSSGNFITIKDALKKYSSDVLKMFYLQAHYSSSVDFSEKNMKAAASALEAFQIFLDKAQRIRESDRLRSVSKDFAFGINKLEQKFTESMDDDFNTPEAMSCLFEIINEANKTDDAQSKGFVFAAEVIEKLTKILGLFRMQEQIDPELKAFVEEKIIQRNQARKAKDFKKADQIRNELQAKGITIEDTKQGTIWRKKI